MSLLWKRDSNEHLKVYKKRKWSKNYMQIEMAGLRMIMLLVLAISTSALKHSLNTIFKTSNDMTITWLKLHLNFLMFFAIMLVALFIILLLWLLIIIGEMFNFNRIYKATISSNNDVKYYICITEGEWKKRYCNEPTQWAYTMKVIKIHNIISSLLVVEGVSKPNSNIKWTCI